MTIRRTTLAAEADDLVVLEGEARRRGISLAALLREVVAEQANTVRDGRRPRFGVVRGDGTATAQISADEHAPARDPVRS